MTNAKITGIYFTRTTSKSSKLFHMGQSIQEWTK